MCIITKRSKVWMQMQFIFHSSCSRYFGGLNHDSQILGAGSIFSLFSYGIGLPFSIKLIFSHKEEILTIKHFYSLYTNFHGLYSSPEFLRSLQVVIHPWFYSFWADNVNFCSTLRFTPARLWNLSKDTVNFSMWALTTSISIYIYIYFFRERSK